MEREEEGRRKGGGREGKGKIEGEGRGGHTSFAKQLDALHYWLQLRHEAGCNLTIASNVSGSCHSN